MAHFKSAVTVTKEITTQGDQWSKLHLWLNGELLTLILKGLYSVLYLMLFHVYFICTKESTSYLTKASFSFKKRDWSCPKKVFSFILLFLVLKRKTKLLRSIGEIKKNCQDWDLYSVFIWHLGSTQNFFQNISAR